MHDPVIGRRLASAVDNLNDADYFIGMEGSDGSTATELIANALDDIRAAMNTLGVATPATP